MNLTFETLGQFARHVSWMRTTERQADEFGRTAVVRTLMQRTQARLGNAALLPPPLAPSTQRERVRLGYSADGTELRDGTLRDSYSMATLGPRQSAFGSPLPYALYQEEGTRRIPARHPIARTARDNNLDAFLLYVRRYVAHLRL